MAGQKDKLQNVLKERFGINKNVSQSLSQADCERLLDLLSNEPSAAKLVDAYAGKNSSLRRNNQQLGIDRSQAERKHAALQGEYHQLQQSIEAIEASKAELESRKRQLEVEQAQLEAEVQDLSSTNQALTSKVQTLITDNDELSTANHQLKKENKDLKNIVDQIRLRLARDTKELLQYEDSQLRKAVIRLFRWTLG
jgi:chromosome segregation ATPase